MFTIYSEVLKDYIRIENNNFYIVFKKYSRV